MREWSRQARPPLGGLDGLDLRGVVSTGSTSVGWSRRVRPPLGGLDRLDLRGVVSTGSTSADASYPHGEHPVFPQRGAANLADRFREQEGAGPTARVT